MKYRKIQLSCCQSEWIVGTLCAHLLLQFYINSFETSQVFCTWSEDIKMPEKWLSSTSGKSDKK